MAAHLLIVAPDSDRRHAWAGALAAAGHDVTVRDHLPPRAWLRAQRFAATILDQRLLVGRDYESIAFCIKAHPVVLVAETPYPWLLEWIADTIAPECSASDLAAAARRAMQLDV